MTGFRDDRVGSALAGTNPTVLRRLTAGFAVIGDVQHLPGYCVLVTDDPAADQLTDLHAAGLGARAVPLFMTDDDATAAIAAHAVALVQG